MRSHQLKLETLSLAGISEQMQLLGRTVGHITSVFLKLILYTKLTFFLQPRLQHNINHPDASKHTCD